MSQIILIDDTNKYMDKILLNQCFPDSIFLNKDLIEKCRCPIDFGILRRPVNYNILHKYLFINSRSLIVVGIVLVKAV